MSISNLKARRGAFLPVLALGLLLCGSCAGQKEAVVEADAAQAEGVKRSFVYATDLRQEDAAKILDQNPVYFEFDRFDLDEEAKGLLREKADILRAYPALSLRIEGHCDNRGTDEYNLALGERRAKAAYDYLVLLGIKPSRLAWVSFGEMYPAVEGQAEDAWGRNRRDEFRPGAN